MRLRWATTVCTLLLLASCGSSDSDTPSAGEPESSAPTSTPASSPESPEASPSADPVLMPDLIGMPQTLAGRALGRIEARHDLGLSSAWGRPVTVRCGTRPETVAFQHPDPGTPLRPGTTVRIRTAALDLARFRGPCEPVDGDLGPVTGPDATLARAFYRFAADPTLGAPFAPGAVWTGIEDGLAGTNLDEAARTDLSAWQLHTTYAERGGPFSALDVVAASGGYYELTRGVAGTCPAGEGEAPPELAGLRALSLTAPRDVTDSCMEWWGVTLFLDGEDHIRGIALRLGSP
ncbi:PASTA domain-containing protein [Nocardioides ferulae]|uniref:PASTA domain-containing protein n=1 Tax=Nocardioides ferulae TaxID=2340821 RepID=UPI000EB4243D|nr:PASTA domain-containing protein [Nocardioides ferulae]